MGEPPGPRAQDSLGRAVLRLVPASA